VRVAKSQGDTVGNDADTNGKFVPNPLLPLARQLLYKEQSPINQVNTCSLPVFSLHCSLILVCEAYLLSTATSQTCAFSLSRRNSVSAECHLLRSFLPMVDLSLPGTLNADRTMSSEPVPGDAGTQLIPVEVLVIVGQFLAGSYCFGTLANLNSASKALHQESQPVLYETLILKYSKEVETSILVCSHPGWKYVRCVQAAVWDV
jgi:hypothetical protein